MAEQKVTKAVIPAAGLGTRFLPATKATPKEMLPVVDKPAIQYVVEEAVAAGLDDILMITGRSKRALEDHFDRQLRTRRDASRQGGPPTGCRSYKRRRIWRRCTTCARANRADWATPFWSRRKHVGNEAFAVLLGDDLIDVRDPLLSRMVEVQERLGGTVIALIEVDPSQIHLYGCAAVVATDEEDVVLVTDLVEKPKENAPSNLAIIGRYVIAPEVFDVLRETPPGAVARFSSPTRCGCSPAALTMAARCTACCSAGVDTTR